MKSIIFLILSFLSVNIYSATCATTTRTNYGYGQLLTSSALNTDLNQLVTKLNAIPGGCISDATLTSAAMDSSFAAILNGIQQGCKLTYSDSNTISLGKCIATVNGGLIRTTAANTATWGCSGCSAEAASTYYYIYIKNGSVGTTVNLLISTVAPNEDGYDASNNKVVGKFYNDVSSNIDQYSVYNWVTNTFISSNAIPSFSGATGNVDSFSISYGATATTTCTANATCAYNDQIGTTGNYISHGVPTGVYTLNMAKTYTKLKCSINCWVGTTSMCISTPIRCENCSTTTFNNTLYSSGAATDSYGTISCQGTY